MTNPVVRRNLEERFGKDLVAEAINECGPDRGKVVMFLHKREPHIGLIYF